MPRKPPTPPSPEVLARMRRELTPDLFRRLQGWAEHACARLLAMEGRDDPGYPKAMVLDAIGDTYAGIRTWDPERVPFSYFLMRVMNSRLSHEMTRARVRRHIPFHASGDASDDTGMITAMSLQRDDERSRPEGQLARLEARARVLSSLRALAADDADVLLLLEGYAADDIRRDEVMARQAWTRGRHTNVRRRLATLVGHLPPDMLESGLDMLTRDGGPPPLTVVRKGERIVPLAGDGSVVDEWDEVDLAMEASNDGGDSCDDGLRQSA